MPQVPSDLSGREVRRALERAGFEFQRQRGSHMMMKRADPPARVVIPDHKAVRVGTLRQILNRAGLSIEDFLGLL